MLQLLGFGFSDTSSFSCSRRQIKARNVNAIMMKNELERSEGMSFTSVNC